MQYFGSFSVQMWRFASRGELGAVYLTALALSLSQKTSCFHNVNNGYCTIPSLNTPHQAMNDKSYRRVV